MSIGTFERREGWGMSTEGISRVVRPQSAREVQDAYRIAAEKGWTVHAWGNGRSYGDAALNESELLLDFSQMNKILHWDRTAGVVEVEPGVTLENLWKHCIEDGFWPPVVSGTMYTTLGGLAAVNAHGKNNGKHGPIGEHIESFELVSPDGRVRDITPDSEPDLFHAAIGGYGWLGAITRITLRMKKVHSGRLEVLPEICSQLEDMFQVFERLKREDWDYIVGWVDAFATGGNIGRGQVHAARYVGQREDTHGEMMLRADEQVLPESFFGVVPKAWLYKFVLPFANRTGMRLINAARFLWMSRPSHTGLRFLQPHAQFNFLLDFVPNWKWIYKPGGLIQVQLFVPADRSREVFRRALETCQQARLEPWLVVMKRHRADAFWLGHAVDGFSLAMDFPVTDHRREDLWRLGKMLAFMVVEAGGRFYPAKDSVVDAEAYRQSLGDEVLGKFFAMKRLVDPGDLLQGNWYRRVMAPIRRSLFGSTEGHSE